MDDRSLLEKAAKAAGIELWHEPVFTNGLTRRVSENGVLCWNPLTDDGDALRLAVKLGIHLGFYGDHVAADRIGGKLATEQSRDGDVQAATRRAIVRAAAAMPEGGQG